MDNKNISTCLGTAILVVIAITAGVFVWVYEKRQGSIPTDIPIQAIQKTPKVLPSQESAIITPRFPEMSQTEKNRLTELTKDWQTYRDTKYGYEFKYPKGYSIEKNKYEADVPEISVVSDGDCVLPFGAKCNVTIRTLSPENERIKNLKNDASNHTTRFQKNGYNITYQLSDGVSAIIQTSERTYFMVSLPYPENAISLFQGIYFTFKEL